MKRTMFFALILSLIMTLTACAAETGAAPSEAGNRAAPAAETTAVTVAETAAEAEKKMVYAHIGSRVLEIVPAENSSAEAFLALLAAGNVTVSMHDYGNFEKVGPLGSTLPTNNENITTEPGDVILYQGDQITIYYDRNSWNFTRLGKVRGLAQAELKEALGDGDVTAVFSLDKILPHDSAAGGLKN